MQAKDNIIITAVTGFEAGRQFYQRQILEGLTRLGDQSLGEWDRTKIEEDIAIARVKLNFTTVRRNRGLL